MEQRIISHYQMFRFNQAYWELGSRERQDIILNLVEKLKQSVETIYCYQVFPARDEWDIMIWLNQTAEENEMPDHYFDKVGGAMNVFRQYIEPGLSLWGFTKPTQYTSNKRNPQEIDPFDESTRTPYFIVYPFVKTIPWYLEDWETRKEMMQEHIKLGKQYPEITQLLLYSFGLQDQEFVVSYETENLSQFSDLVYELRKSEARRYTERDTPIITGIHRSPEKLGEIFS